MTSNTSWGLMAAFTSCQGREGGREGGRGRGMSGRHWWKKEGGREGGACIDLLHQLLIDHLSTGGVHDDGEKGRKGRREGGREG